MHSGVVLLGGGGHASDVLCVVEALRSAGSEVGQIYVADDTWRESTAFQDRSGVKVVESIEAGAQLARFIVSVGYPATRKMLYERAIGVGGCHAAAIIHPNTSVGYSVNLEDGAVVMGQSWISAMVDVGRHTHIGYGSTIGHDTIIGEFSSVMPGACIGGSVSIGDEAFIGANATILQGLSVGDGSVVGAGAVVTKDVKPGQTVVGVPGRELYR